jgi:hypothetical protein
MTRVTLTDDHIKFCDEMAQKIVARYSNGPTMAIMPWSRDKLSKDELRQWLASRKEAAQAIDVESCEVGVWYADELDPYGIDRALGEFCLDGASINRVGFVRSPDSNGWVYVGDLPDQKYSALLDRTEREWQAYCAAHPDDANDYMDVPF